MKFYNTIFASAYRSYDKYENSPAKYRASSFVFVHMLGLVFLIVCVIQKTFSLDFTGVRKFPGYQLIFLMIGFFFLSRLWKYYSKDRIEILVKDFEQKPLLQRRLWGYVAVITLILEFVVAAVVLNYVNGVL